jgi:shikimate 5-dehydrogenase
MREAQAAGCETLGGLPMLLAQAAQQFQLWTGGTANVDVMQTAALEALSSNH